MERARRLEDLAVQVMTAVGERDAAVAKAEKRAGAALREMTTVEGVTLRAAVEWCGDQIGVREATRLRRLAENGHEDGATPLAATAAAAESVEEVAVRRLADRPRSMAAIVAPHCRTVSLPGMERATRGECGDSSELDELFVPKPLEPLEQRDAPRGQPATDRAAPTAEERSVRDHDDTTPTQSVTKRQLRRLVAPAAAYDPTSALTLSTNPTSACCGGPNE